MQFGKLKSMVRHCNVLRPLQPKRKRVLTASLEKEPGADQGGGCRGCAPLPEMTYSFLIQLVFCKKVWFIGVSYAIP